VENNRAEKKSRAARTKKKINQLVGDIVAEEGRGHPFHDSAGEIEKTSACLQVRGEEDED